MKRVSQERIPKNSMCLNIVGEDTVGEDTIGVDTIMGTFRDNIGKDTPDDQRIPREKIP